MKLTHKIIVMVILSTIKLGCAQNTPTEVYAVLDQAVGNIAYTDDGILVFSHHPFFKPEVRVAKYDAATKAPFYIFRFKPMKEGIFGR